MLVHLTPSGVASLEQYRRWMDSFGVGHGTVQHIMANTAANGGRTIMGSSAAVQAHLNALAPAIFALPSTSWMLNRPDGTYGWQGASIYVPMMVPGLPGMIKMIQSVSGHVQLAMCSRGSVSLRQHVVPCARKSNC